MANVRKLMRMAREFEADEGRDLRGFIDAVAERDVIQAREGEAPLEAEALDAVRMMTVHRAKGLEFPVVCLADLGKDGREDDGQLRISDDGSVGLRLASLGGGAVDSAKLAEHQGAGEARRRGGGAAHLLRGRHARAGAPRAERRHRPRQAPGPGRAARADALDLARLLRRACPSEGATGIAHDAYEGRDVAVRWTRCTPATVDEVLPAGRPRAGRARGRASRRPSSSRCSSSACRRRRARSR